MDLFLKVLEKKVSHRDRWFRFVDAIKNAGMQYRVTSYAMYIYTFLMPLMEKRSR